MPVPTNEEPIKMYRSASKIPKQVLGDMIHANPVAANIILSQIEKLRAADNKPQVKQVDNYWFVYSSQNSTPSTQFVLSCTEGPLRSYPIFIFTAIPEHDITSGKQDITLPVCRLASALHDAVPLASRRVFSIFSVKPVTEVFVTAWKQLTGIDAVREAYYDATLTFCTKETAKGENSIDDDNYTLVLDRATSEDRKEIGDLCFDFAKTSDPFDLSVAEAQEDAERMVSGRRVWVHRIQRRSDGERGIASIVASTRESSGVAAITKVYTNEKWRKLRCAERLVRYVTNELLKTNHTVVLYVGRGNNAANVYRKVGFVGLDHPEPTDGAERWLEIGFDRSKVDLGHW